MRQRTMQKRGSIPGYMAVSMMLALSVVALPRPVIAAVSSPVAPATNVKGLSSEGAKAFPNMVVHKNPGCLCCDAWAKHLRANGFKVDVMEDADLAAFKKKVGVPAAKGSCHTGLIGGLFIEGHVPADAIKAALAKRTGVRGLVLPGMPAGVPGMPAPPGGPKSYTVEWVDAKGGTHPFRTYRR